MLPKKRLKLAGPAFKESVRLCANASDRFFALIADDTLYLKVDESNRPDFEARGMGPFRPYAEHGEVMQYYEVPADLLDDPEALRPWAEKAITVAGRKKVKRSSRGGP